MHVSHIDPFWNFQLIMKINLPDDSFSYRWQVRKEKLGDRIAALQQLVSPFGKVGNYVQGFTWFKFDLTRKWMICDFFGNLKMLQTDTASVLHEAMGYIRFLHDQVQVLCSPYLQHLPVSTNTSFLKYVTTNKWWKKDLRVLFNCDVRMVEKTEVKKQERTWRAGGCAWSQLPAPCTWQIATVLISGPQQWETMLQSSESFLVSKYTFVTWLPRALA